MSAGQARLLITTTVDGREKTQTWDGEGSLVLARPFQAASLERVSDTQVKLGARGGPGQTIDVAGLGPEGRLFEIRPGASVRVRPTRSIAPAYSEPPRNGTALQSSTLLAPYVFSGAGKSLLDFRRVHGRFAGYARGTRVFRLDRAGKAGFRLRPDVDDLVIRDRDGKVVTLLGGTKKDYTADELLGTQLSWGGGLYWWRFSVLHAPMEILDVADTDLNDAETLWARKAAIYSVLSLFLLGAVLWLWPATPLTPTTPTDEPIAAKIEPPKKKFFAAPRPLSKVLEPESPAPAAPAKAPEPAPAPKKAIQAAPPPVVKAPVAVAPPAPDKAKILLERRKQMLQEALGGVVSALKDTAPAATPPKSAPVTALLSGGAPMALGQTQVKAEYGGSRVETAKMGSGGAGYGAVTESAVSGRGSAKGFVGFDGKGSAVSQGLTREEVDAVIRSHMSEVKFCYESALLTQPEIQGRVVVGFAVAPGGKVVEPRVESSDLPGDKLAACIVQHLGRWTFPSPRGGVTVDISYPFVFKTLGKE